MRPVAALALALAASFLPGRNAIAGDKPKAAPKVGLRDAGIVDQPTTVSVPLSAESSVFVGVPPRLFQQCPRTSTIPTSLDGDGVILQDVWNTSSGNAHTVAYVGAVALPKSDPNQSFADRVARFVPSFVSGLREKYARVDFQLVTDAIGIKLEKAQLKVDGKPVAAWRTSKYVTQPASNANKSALFTGEAAFIGDAASDKLIYLVLDSKGRSMPLDRILDGLSIQKTFDARRKGHLVQLNDISNALDGRYPVRLAAFESPPGFAPTLATVRAGEETVYAEQRLDDKGVVTAAYRIDHRDHGDTMSLGGELELERASRGAKNSGTPTLVALATPGAQAFVLTYKTKVGDRPAVARSAVLQLDDKVWIITWTSFGDEISVDTDGVTFETMLKTIQLAIR